MTRARPNILITGTPGTGKTCLAQQLIQKEVCKDLTLISIGSLSKDKNLYLEFDDEFECHVLDEDAVLHELSHRFKAGGDLTAGGVIFEHHLCDFLPKEWIDVVYVLRADNTVLYDRLKERGYSDKKLQSNLECEIFQTIFDEAVESFENVIQLRNDCEADQTANLESICRFIREWTQQPEMKEQGHETRR